MNEKKNEKPPCGKFRVSWAAEPGEDEKARLARVRERWLVYVGDVQERIAQLREDVEKEADPAKRDSLLEELGYCEMKRLAMLLADMR